MTLQDIPIPKAVEEAQSALDAARARHAEAVQAEKDAMAAVAAAQGALIEARARDDLLLPKARMIGYTWQGKMTSDDVVVARRTAKTITVRRPGETGEWSFRQNVRGEWREYPARLGFGAVQNTLEISA